MQEGYRDSHHASIIHKNLFLCSTSCATYSRNRENGGFVTTISASLSNFVHSSLRKSPPPRRGVAVFLSCFSKYSTSSRFIAPSLSVSGTSLISILKGSLPDGFNPSTSNSGNCPPTIGKEPFKI